MYAGIDYSLTSPAITLLGQDGRFKFFFFHKVDVDDENFQVSKMERFENQQARHDFLSDWAIEILLENRVKFVCLEGYAFGGVGKVFNIAENTGLLKHKMWKNNIEFITPAPSEIKKFACGKGNAKKEQIVSVFEEENDIELRSILKIDSEKVWNPISDIADSYFMMKYAVERKNDQGKTKKCD